MSATNRGSIRVCQDLYLTPHYAIDLIFSRINLSAVLTSLEPCRADRRIYNRLPGAVYWCEIGESLDYLTWSPPIAQRPVDLCLTNPPFSLSLEFLKKSLSECSTVIYLLRLNFLGTEKRRSFWEHNKPSHLYVLSQRPSFDGHGVDATEYAWFCWDRGGFILDSPGIYVLGGPTEAVDAELFS